MDFRLNGREPSFEETYPQAPFSELIRLAITGAGALRSALDRLGLMRDRYRAARTSDILPETELKPHA